MSVSLADLRADCGEVYDSLTNGTTAAASLLSKAQSKVSGITGSTTGFDLPIRNLADANICQQFLGSSSAANVSVGSISVGRKQIKEMRDQFLAEAKDDLARLGYTLNTANILFEMTTS